VHELDCITSTETVETVSLNNHYLFTGRYSYTNFMLFAPCTV